MINVNCVNILEQIYWYNNFSVVPVLYQISITLYRTHIESINKLIIILFVLNFRHSYIFKKRFIFLNISLEPNFGKYRAYNIHIYVYTISYRYKLVTE